MNRNRILLIINLLLFVTLQVSGQSFRSGYIIENNGDTLHGQIQYKAGKNASQECTFHPSDGIMQTYKPGKIKAYRFDEGKFYITKQIPVSNDTLLLFAEYLIEGLANIYYVNYINVDHYYVETEKKGLVELTEPERIAQINDINYALPKKYKGKLTYILDDYDDIQSEVEDVELNHKSLIKLANKYHDALCDSGQCIIFEKKVKKMILKYGPSAGFLLTRYNFGNKIIGSFEFGVCFGGFVELKNIVVSNERFSLQLDIAIQKDFSQHFKIPSAVSPQRVIYNGTTYYIIQSSDDTLNGFRLSTKELETRINVVSLKIPVTINYSGLSDFFRYYLGFGLNTMFVLSQNKNFKFPYFEDEYNKTVPEFLFGIKTRIGLDFPVFNENDLSFELNYDYLMNYNMYKTYRLNISSFALMIRYQF